MSLILFFIFYYVYYVSFFSYSLVFLSDVLVLVC